MLLLRKLQDFIKKFITYLKIKKNKDNLRILEMLICRDKNNKFMVGDSIRINNSSTKYLIVSKGEDEEGNPYLRCTDNYLTRELYEHIVIYLKEDDIIEFYYKSDENKYLKILKSINEGKMNKIKDSSGKMIDSNKAVKTLDNELYSIDDVIEVEGGGYLNKSSKSLVLDCIESTELKPRYLHVARSISVYKIISVNNDSGNIEVKEERTSKNNLYKLCCVESTILGIIRVSNSVEELLKLDLIESMNNGVFYTRKNISNAPSKQLKYKEFNWIKKATGDKIKDYKFGTFSPSYRAFEGHKYSFGIELECSRLYLPEHLSNNLNILCVRDGSISNDNNGDERGGPEIVTGVLVGDTGLQQLQLICNEASRRGDINKSCGVHIHVGGASFNNAFIVFAYKLGLILEEDLFAMLPPSRRKNEFCRNLPKVSLLFENIKGKEDLEIRVDNYHAEIFKLMAGEGPSAKLNKNMNHPRGSKVGYNHSHPRYSHINFVPAMFNTRESKDPTKTMTLEFRAHSATTNFTKIKNWLKICMAFVYFADNHQQDIINGFVKINGSKEPINLDSIIKVAFPNNNNSLIDYINKRKEIFSDVNKEKSQNAESAEYKKNRDISTQKLKELIN
jgi:putative amidoligase enzyme